MHTVISVLQAKTLHKDAHSSVVILFSMALHWNHSIVYGVHHPVYTSWIAIRRFIQMKLSNDNQNETLLSSTKKNCPLDFPKKNGRTTNVALCIYGSNAIEFSACFQTFYRNQIHLNNMHEFAHCFSALHIHMPHAKSHEMCKRKHKVCDDLFRLCLSSVLIKIYEIAHT